jgi:hypothetical protein
LDLITPRPRAVTDWAKKIALFIPDTY